MACLHVSQEAVWHILTGHPAGSTVSWFAGEMGPVFSFEMSGKLMHL